MLPTCVDATVVSLAQRTVGLTASHGERSLPFGILGDSTASSPGPQEYCEIGGSGDLRSGCRAGGEPRAGVGRSAGVLRQAASLWTKRRIVLVPYLPVCALMRMGEFGEQFWRGPAN